MAWWRLDDRAVPLEERAQKALERHEFKFGEAPNVLRVWPDCPDIKGLKGVTVERCKRIPRNVFETEVSRNHKRKSTKDA